jgi:hypothetical protein
MDLGRARNRNSPELPVFLLALILSLGWVFTANAQAKFAPSNGAQERCIRAFDETLELPEGPAEIDSWDDFIEWGTKKYGSQEAFGRAMEARQHEHIAETVDLLRPAADAGHLPSMYLMLTYFRGESVPTDLAGLPTPAEREAWPLRLYDAGFPLASQPTPAGAYDNGFHGHHKPPPSEEFLRKLKPQALPRIRERLAREVYTSHEEAAKLRRAYVEALKWGAARGNTSRWESLESAYDQIVARFGGGIEYQVERYALLELTKRRWLLGEEFNVPKDDQEELAVKLAAEGRLEAAKALARRYVETLWPRRIETRSSQDKCRLRPQFAGEVDPYSGEREVLTKLETPVPPALRPPPKARRIVTPIPPGRRGARPDQLPYPADGSHY